MQVTRWQARTRRQHLLPVLQPLLRLLLQVPPVPLQAPLQPLTRLLRLLVRLPLLQPLQPLQPLLLPQQPRLLHLLQHRLLLPLTQLLL